MPQLVLSLLGTFRATLDGRPITAFESNKVRAMLAFLAAEVNSPHSRARLAGLLWPDFPNRAATDNLRFGLSNLRGAIGDRDAAPPFLLITRDTIQFNPASDHHTDVEAWITARRKSPEPAVEAAAMTHYRGKFLDGFSIDSPAFEEWVLLKREQIDQSVLYALREWATAAEGRGDLDRAQAYARKQLELEPWDEAAHRQLMRALALNGQQSMALSQYEACRRMLKEELGAEPSPETNSLYADIREGRFGATPPGRVAARRERGWTNLHGALTSFVGRKRELVQIARLVRNTRLLTLTGSGGSGKTRLAAQAASSLAETNRFPDGIAWIDLAATNNPTLVEPVVAAVFGLRESQIPVLTVLTDHLRGMTLLLVLDNCEHLVEASAALAHTLLTQCPGLHILATSREPLRVPGEVVWNVPPLSLPAASQAAALTAKQLARYDAIQLFAARARAVRSEWQFAPDAAGVAELCIKLEGIPLAIELAASRLRVLAVQQILARLDDRLNLLADGSRTAVPHHRTLRATMDWSYDLLVPAERTLLQQLAVFSGGFSLEAAEFVYANRADGDLPGIQKSSEERPLLSLLASLVDKSLLVSEPTGDTTRYRMLETVRQYALEKADQAGEISRVSRSHLEFFARTAEQANFKLMSAEEPFWVTQLEAEHENIRGALGWGLKHDVDGVVRLASSLHVFWDLSGYLKEGRQWLTRILSKLEGEEPDIRRARLLNALGHIMRAQVDYAPLAETFEKSLAISRACGDPVQEAYALYGLGTAHFFLGAKAARERLEQAQVLAQEAGDMSLSSRILRFLAAVAAEEGDSEAVARLLGQALARAREAGDRISTANVLNGLGVAATQHKDYSRAMAFHEEALALCTGRPSGGVRPLTLVYLGHGALLQENYRQSREMLAQSVKLYRDLGSTTGQVRGLRHLAGLAVATGKPAQAARLLGAATSACQRFRMATLRNERQQHARYRNQAFARLGKQAFRDAWREGLAMTLEEAVEEAFSMTIPGAREVPPRRVVDSRPPPRSRRRI